MKSNIDEDGALPEISKEVDGEHAEQEEDSPKPPSSGEKEQSSIKQDDDQQIRLAKAQMGEVREENERLKQLLSNIVKDYQSLQMHFFQIMQQVEAEKTKKVAPTHQVKEETELTSLSLGRKNSSEPKKEEIRKSGNNSGEGKGDAKFGDEGLSLGLDCKFEVDSSVAVKNPTSENSIGETKEEEPTETWPPSKMLKTTSSADDEVSQQPQMKKARVSVRTRCDTPTMHDGCQWRKYGQKIAKGNPCPRAYYRCTISPTCPVRKQVQRCIDDTSILITTYEGTHNHPLPLSATAMASTTSAAASMLNSRPSTSQQAGSLGTSISAPISFSTSTLPSGLNFSLSQNTIMPYQFPFPSTSISTANSHPTITLDLTNSGSIHHFNDRFPSSAAPRYSQSTCLSFSSPSPPSTSWNTNYPTCGSLANKQPPSREHLHQSNHMQMNNGNQTINSSQQAITAEAVKAIIASNPTFRSALAAAITSFVGNGNGGVRENTTTPGLGERIPGLNLHLGQSSGFNNTMPYSSSGSQNGSIGCGSNYLKEPPPSLSSQQVSLALFPPSLPLPTSSNASGSPASSRDHVKRSG